MHAGDEGCIYDKVRASGSSDSSYPARPDAERFFSFVFGNSSQNPHVEPPLPSGESYPSGPIITLTIPVGVSLVVDGYIFRHADGTDVPAMFTTPANNNLLQRTTALYALNPLDPMTTYTVTFKGNKGNANWGRTWTFTTGPTGTIWDYRF